MPRRSRPTIIVASLLAAACLGAGGGAVAYATLHDNGTTTVIKQVTVQQADQASVSPLSVNQIYRRAYRGVVEITVTEAAHRAAVRRRWRPGPGTGLRLGLRHRRPHRHERPRRQRLHLDQGPLLGRQDVLGQRRGRRQVDRPRRDQGRRACPPSSTRSRSATRSSSRSVTASSRSAARSGSRRR